jgi:hypothetical protein
MDSLMTFVSRMKNLDPNSTTEDNDEGVVRHGDDDDGQHVLPVTPHGSPTSSPDPKCGKGQNVAKFTPTELEDVVVVVGGGGGGDDDNDNDDDGTTTTTTTTRRSRVVKKK